MPRRHRRKEAAPDLTRHGLASFDEPHFPIVFLAYSSRGLKAAALLRIPDTIFRFPAMISGCCRNKWYALS